MNFSNEFAAIIISASGIVGLLIVIGGSLLAAGGAGVAGYWLSRTFG